VRAGSGPDAEPDEGETGLGGGAVPGGVEGWAVPAGAIPLEVPPGGTPPGVPDGEGDVVRALGAIGAELGAGRDSIPGRAESP